LIVNIDFSRYGLEWRARIDLQSAAGQSLGRRSIESRGSDCSDMNESLALVLALMVDLTRQEVEKQAPLSEPEVTHEVHALETKSESTWSTAMTLGLLSTVGQLPNVGWGGRLASKLRYRAGLGIEFGASALAPSTWSDDQGARAKFNAYSVDVGLCANLLAGSRSLLDWCAGPQLSLTRAAASGFAVNRAQTLTTLSPFAALHSSYRLVASLGVHLALVALVPLARDRFFATQADGTQTTIHSVPWVAAQLEAGLSLGL
jgi:hypothetical protein